MWHKYCSLIAHNSYDLLMNFTSNATVPNFKKDGMEVNQNKRCTCGHAEIYKQEERTCEADKTRSFMVKTQPSSLSSSWFSKGALSRYFSALKNVEICRHINENSKVGMVFDYWRPFNYPETDGWPLLLQTAWMEIYWILNNLASSSQVLAENQKCTMHGILFLQKIDCCLSPRFFARVKVRKKDCCIVLTGKQQKCRDRAPLSN